MKRILFWSFLLTCFLLQPVGAQDTDDDDDGGFEVDGGPGQGGDEGKKDDGYDPEETKRKNSGLAGGGKGQDDDPNAPKVKASLQVQINEAIKKGVDWLKKAQAKDGSYPPVTANRDYETGKDIGTRIRDELAPTAWAVYTLAKCGEKRSSPAVKKGVKYILDQTEFVWDVMGGKDAKIGGREKLQEPSRSNPRTLSTYEAAAIVMMIEAVYQKSAKLTGKHRKRRLYSDNPLKPPSGSKIPKKVWKYMHDRVVYLTTGRRIKTGGARGKGGSSKLPGLQVPDGPNKGGWRYAPAQGGGSADLSATQFALLALRAASQAGYPVEKTSRNVWYDAARYVKKCQRGDGGFGYQIGGGASDGAMTACGLGSLLICREQMLLAKQYDDEARQPQEWIDDAIKRGTDWLDKNFAPNRNPGAHKHVYYYLYGVERVGDLSDRKEFNGLDWYVRGARFLLKHQDAAGQWTDATEFPPRDVNATTLALLFLKRATPPVVTISDRDAKAK